MLFAPISPPTRIALIASLLTSVALLQPSISHAAPSGGQRDSSRIVFGTARPSIAFCDPGRASSTGHGEWFRGVSIEGICGDVTVSFPHMTLGQRVSHAAFNYSGSPGTTLTGVNWIMSEAVLYDDRTGELGLGGKWYLPRERGLAGFEFEAKGAGKALEVLVRAPGSASNMLIRFGERNPIGYRAATEILGAQGYRVSYGGTPQNPEITHTDGKGFKTQILYKTAETRESTTVIDKVFVDPSGASFLLATFEITTMAGSNYVTRYRDAANGLSFSMEYTRGMNTISLPEAFASHGEGDMLNGQVLRALSSISTVEPSPSGAPTPVPRLDMRFLRNAETPTLISGTKEKFISTSEARIGALQFSIGESRLEDHVKSDGSSSTENSLSGFSNWSYKDVRTLEFPRNVARRAQNFTTQESAAGTTLRYERNPVGAITAVFQKLRGGREFKQVATERDGYWVKAVTDYNRTRTEKTGSPIYPTSITTKDSLGRFATYQFTYTTFKDPRAEALTQTLLSRVAFSDSLGRKWSEQFFWDRDKLTGARTADGTRVDRTDAALVIKAHTGAELASYEIDDSPIRKLVSQREIFRLEQSASAGSASSRAEFAGGVMSSSKATSAESDRPGLLSLSSMTGENTNAEGARNKTVAFSNLNGLTVQSSGEQGTFTANVSTGLQQAVPSVSCSANGVTTTGKSCARAIGVQPPKKTTYGGGGLGIEKIECLPTEPGAKQARIGVWYTNAFESINAKATIQSIGGETRTILEDGRSEFTKIEAVGALFCEGGGDFPPTKTEESKMIACRLPAGARAGDKLVLFAGIMRECAPVLDEQGNASHCGAPVLAEAPSFTGVYSNWWSVPDCPLSDEPVPDVTPLGMGESDDPILDEPDAGLSR
ncbi:MAG: hypothetical protein RL326_782 [Pseudomonadota bacterium]